jgi:hypothetical protein
MASVAAWTGSARQRIARLIHLSMNRPVWCPGFSRPGVDGGSDVEPAKAGTPNIIKECR